MRVTELNARLERVRAECRAAIVTRQRATTPATQRHWSLRIGGLHQTIARLELELKTAEPTADELKARLVALEAQCKAALRGARLNPRPDGRMHWRARANVLQREIAAVRAALQAARAAEREGASA